MKKCPFDRCARRVADKMFCCSDHWHAMPADLRDEVTEVYNRWLKETASVSEVHEVHESVLARAQGRTPPVPTVGSIASCCRRCGAQTLLAHKADGTGLVTLVPRLRSHGDVPVFVIVGGMAEPERPTHPASYARMTQHVCRVAAAATKGAQ